MGARIGATPITRVISEKTRAASCTGKTSRTIARAMTMAAQPPMAWRKRNATRAQMFGARAQPAEASVKRAMPTSIGFLRPMRSEIGP
ncbi:hypothetical protein D3C72_2258780 [compost metagenome]